MEYIYIYVKPRSIENIPFQSLQLNMPHMQSPNSRHMPFKMERIHRLIISPKTSITKCRKAPVSINSQMGGMTIHKIPNIIRNFENPSMVPHRFSADLIVKGLTLAAAQPIDRRDRRSIECLLATHPRFSAQNQARKYYKCKNSSPKCHLPIE